MAQTITQTNSTRRTNRTRTQVQTRLAAQANTSNPSQSCSRDGVSISTRAQAAMAANQVRDVMSNLGFSVGRSTTDTARTTPRRSSNSSASFGNVGTDVSGRGRLNLSPRITESRRSPSAGQRALEILDTASILNPVTAPLTIGRRVATLGAIESGLVNPDSSSRLGAYQATAGNERGTTGRAAHNSIGAIYMLLGNFGQDRIGDVFNSREARELYDQPLSNGSSRQLAETEHAYWENQRRTHGSAGGYMGGAVSPAARDLIQQVMGRI